MKIAALISLGLALVWWCVGCSATRGERTLPDGTRLAVSNYRLLWASEGIDFSVTDTNGFKTTLRVQKSNPHAESLKAVAEGLAEGTTKGLTGKQ